MSLRIKMEADGTKSSVLDLYGWIKEEECVCVWESDMLTVWVSGEGHKDWQRSAWRAKTLHHSRRVMKSESGRRKLGRMFLFTFHDQLDEATEEQSS